MAGLIEDLEEMILSFGRARLTHSDKIAIHNSRSDLCVRDHQMIDRGRNDVLVSLTSILSKHS
jgi:hypothetical protein